MIEDEQAWALVDRYNAVRTLLLTLLTEVSKVEADADEDLRILLYKHRMSMLNQLALIEGHSRFVVIQGSQAGAST